MTSVAALARAEPGPLDLLFVWWRPLPPALLAGVDNWISLVFGSAPALLQQPDSSPVETSIPSAVRPLSRLALRRRRGATSGVSLLQTLNKDGKLLVLFLLTPLLKPAFATIELQPTAVSVVVVNCDFF